jgi:hypothetical protein
MNDKLKLILGLFLIGFIILLGIDIFSQNNDVDVSRNLIISLFATGVVCLYGGLLHLVTNKKRHL